MRLLPLIALLLAVSGCSSDAPASEQEDWTIVATTTQAADIARNAAARDVRGLIPPGADPHDHELRPEDLEALAEADVVVRSGGELDDWLDEAIESSGFDGALVNLMPEGGDPHWWHDPRAAVEAAASIGTVAGVEGQAYRDEIAALDRAIERCADRVPRSKRVLVTTHDALGAFADRYGFTVVGTVIPSNSTQAQPSSKDLARLVKDVRKAGVKTIFPETAVSADVEKAIAEEAGVEVGEPLYADALGPKGSPGDTYLKATAFNARAILASVGARCEL
jgi:zinc/manganese transport system substrate-binding protein/manganese/iron transport system substrate-binding protein